MQGSDLERLAAHLISGLRGAQVADEPPPLARYVPQVAAALRRWGRPFDAAAVAGSQAQCVAHAFAAGYQAAMRALLPVLDADEIVALCVTEEGGGHAAAIRASLQPAERGYSLSGSKRWVTLGETASRLLVAASVGVRADGRNDLRLVDLPSRAAGVTFLPMPPTPFATEITHASVRFEAVHVDEAAVLPGDGYERYIKPFRTIEDIHVQAALLGHLLRVAWAVDWPGAVKARLLAALAGLRAIDEGDRASAALHVVLGGALDGLVRLYTELEPYWSQASEAVRGRWRRDQGLLGVAEAARRKRLEVAWTKVGA